MRSVEIWVLLICLAAGLIWNWLKHAVTASSLESQRIRDEEIAKAEAELKAEAAALIAQAENLPVGQANEDWNKQ